MNKKIIRITENDLHYIIMETVNNILSEYDEKKKKEEMKQDFETKELEYMRDCDMTKEELEDKANKNIHDYHNKKEEYPF